MKTWEENPHLSFSKLVRRFTCSSCHLLRLAQRSSVVIYGSVGGKEQVVIVVQSTRSDRMILIQVSGIVLEIGNEIRVVLIGLELG